MASLSACSHCPHKIVGVLDSMFMDNNGGSPSRGEEPPMKREDWRSQLQADSRERIVNKILDTLKRHLPYSGEEGLQELKKISVRFEEKIHACATSQSDYLRKISLKMLTMESRPKNTVASSLPSNSNDSSMQQEQRTIPSMEYSGINAIPLQSPDNQMSPQQQSMNNTIRVQQFSSSPLSGVSSAQKNMFNPFSQIQSEPAHMQQLMNTLQQSILLQQRLALNHQKQLYPAQRSLPETSSTSLDSTAQTGDTEGAHWQGEAYPKIKVLNEMYYPELTQVPSTEMEMNPQLQSSAPPMLQNNVTSLQLNNVPSLSSVSTADTFINSPRQISSNTELRQGDDSLKSLQVSIDSIMQTPHGFPRGVCINTLSSESGTNMMRANTLPIQTNADFLHNRYLQQQQQLNLMHLRSQQQQQQQLKQMHLRSQQLQQLKQMHLRSQQQQLQLMQDNQVSHQTRNKEVGQLMLQKFEPKVPQVNTVSDMNTSPLLPSQNGSNMLQGSIDSLNSSSSIVINKQQEQEEKKLQNQPMQPCKHITMQQQWTQNPQMLLEKQQQQIQQLQQHAKQQLHHIYFVYLIFLTILLGAYHFGSGY